MLLMKMEIKSLVYKSSFMRRDFQENLRRKDKRVTSIVFSHAMNFQH